jgi:hypothetical protein
LGLPERISQSESVSRQRLRWAPRIGMRKGWEWFSLSGEGMLQRVPARQTMLGPGGHQKPPPVATCTWVGGQEVALVVGLLGRAVMAWEVTNTLRKCDHPGLPGTLRQQPTVSHAQMARRSGSHPPQCQPPTPERAQGPAERGPLAKLFVAKLQTARNIRTRRQSVQRGRWQPGVSTGCLPGRQV